jgi:hypothetical protein
MTSPSAYHSPVDKGGLGLPTMLGLATKACGTELIVRLNSAGLVGDIARERLRAARVVRPDPLSRHVNPNTRVHFVLYVEKTADPRN